MDTCWGLKCRDAVGGATGRKNASEMGKEWAEGYEDTKAGEGPTDCQRESGCVWTSAAGEGLSGHLGGGCGSCAGLTFPSL